MKKTILFLLFIPLLTFAQKEVKPGSSKYLDYKHGFKNIILGSDIAGYDGKIKLVSKEKNDVSYYSYTDRSDTVIAGVSILKIIIKTFHNNVANIIVYVNRENAASLYGIFVAGYGNDYDWPNTLEHKFSWFGKNVMLKYDYESSEPVAEFIDLPLMNELFKIHQSNTEKAVSEL